MLCDVGSSSPLPWSTLFSTKGRLNSAKLIIYSTPSRVSLWCCIPLTAAGLSKAESSPGPKRRLELSRLPGETVRVVGAGDLRGAVSGLESHLK